MSEIEMNPILVGMKSVEKIGVQDTSEKICEIRKNLDQYNDTIRDAGFAFSRTGDPIGIAEVKGDDVGPAVFFLGYDAGGYFLKHKDEIWHFNRVDEMLKNLGIGMETILQGREYDPRNKIGF